jgi:uncharacterized membrane protein (UPF0127 family)
MDNGTVTIDSLIWNVKLATSAADITAGFSNVVSTPPQTGILFEFAQPANGFVVNMQQMLFPIDIAFINANGIIADIARNVQPLNDYTDTVDAVSFLEVNANELASVNVGDAIVVNDTSIIAPSLLGGIDLGSIISIMLVMMIMKMMMGAMK